MAASTFSAAPIASTTAAVLAWGKGLSDALQAVGLVKTADTGQINWATFTLGSTGGGQSLGYEIYRFSDTLQATKPVFFKIVYGTATGGSSFYSIVITTGTATDGAGTLSGNGFATNLTLPALNSTNAYPCYVSSDGSYLNIAMFVGAQAVNTGLPRFWSFDRTRNADGTGNGDGLYALNAAGQSSTFQVYTVVPFSGASVPGLSGGAPCIFPQWSVTGTAYNNGLQGANVSFFPHIVHSPQIQAAALSVLGVFAADVPTGTPQVVTTHGTTHTFMALGTAVGFCAAPLSNNSGTGASYLSTASAMMRYE